VELLNRKNCLMRFFRVFNYEGWVASFQQDSSVLENKVVSSKLWKLYSRKEQNDWDN